MDLDQVELTLLRSPSDPERVCYETTAKLVGIHETLRKRGVSVTSIIAHPACDTHVSQFVFTLGPYAIAAIGAVAGAWVQTRFGRRIRLKFDEVEAEARTAQEIDELLKHLTPSGTAGEMLASVGREPARPDRLAQILGGGC
jgi:hypothetical protein